MEFYCVYVNSNGDVIEWCKVVGTTLWDNLKLVAGE
jgi:hypothetical protein